MLALAVIEMFQGCGGQGDAASEVVSCVASSEDPVALDEPSSLGFSADEVLGTVNQDVTVAVTDLDGAEVERSFVLEFVPDGTAQVEEIDEAACAHVVPGPSLAIPGTLSLTVDDGWLVASGAATVRAQGSDSAEVWVYSVATVSEASTELWSAVTAAHEGCDEENITISVIQNSMPDTPWSFGPLGGMNTDGCGQGVYGVFRWGAVSFY